MKCPICGRKYWGASCPECGGSTQSDFADNRFEQAPSAQDMFAEEPATTANATFNTAAAPPRPVPRGKGGAKWILLITLILFTVILVLTLILFSRTPSMAIPDPVPENSMDGSTEQSAIVLEGQRYREYSVTEDDITVENFPEIAVDSGFGITVTLLDVTSEYSDCELTMKIENTTDAPLNVSLINFSVNGVMMDPLHVRCNLEPHTSTLDNSFIWVSELVERNVRTMSQMEMTVRAENPETGAVHVSEPIVFEASKATASSPAPRGTTVLDENGLRILYIGASEIDDYETFPALWFYVENNTGRAYDFEADTLRIGDKTVNATVENELVVDGKAAYIYVRQGYSQKLPGNALEKADSASAVLYATRQYDSSYRLLEPFAVTISLTD